MAALIGSGRILCRTSEIRLDRILKSGQSFRWKEEKPGVWTGVLFNKIWKFWQSESAITFQVFGNQKEVKVEGEPEKIKGKEDLGATEDSNNTTVQSVTRERDNTELVYEDLIKDYFQLRVKVENLYKEWSEVDSNFQIVSLKFEGIRILRQDPVENLFSIICSSNNHISRISSMVEKLCENYGTEVGEVDGRTYFSFPSVSDISQDGVENELRNLGFGYRAKYINQSARQIVNKGGELWLRSLREKPYEEAKRELMALSGVGAKVADCVCLMSLDKTDALPVDTHVWQIAARDYLPKLSNSKTLTDKLYKEIGDHFRTLWGPYAGWAQAVLFTADLKQFKDKIESPPSKTKTKKSDDESGSPTKKTRTETKSRLDACKSQNNQRRKKKW
ncbi:N-glycosylase/DNA lyase-like isoform X1 [Crassostrea virginica]